jgi:hypothetical protein
MAVLSNERTPLLDNGDINGGGAGPGSATPSDTKPASSASRWQRLATPEMRLMLAAFFITVGLCFTQVPYVMRIGRLTATEN